MLSQTKEIRVDQLAHEVLSLMQDGCRFVTMTCTDIGAVYDVIYHFDKAYQLHNLRIALGKEETLPSISAICFPALIVENEIQDMFGIKVTGLAIDYQGRFILAESAPKAPLAKKTPGMDIDVRVLPAGENRGGVQ